MKKLLLLLSGLVLSCTSEAKKVKFAVDMTGVTVSANGIHVMGDFQTAAGFAGADWMANTTLLSLEPSTQIYSIVVDLPAFQKYEYKFVNGDQSYESEFVPDESRVDPTANDNRWIYVDSLTTDTTFVGAIRFGDQTTGEGNAPMGKTLLRFKVNMRNYSPVASTGVHVAGTFQGFDPATTRMYSFSDSIYQHIAYVTPGTISYLYHNGNIAAAAETLPAACAASGLRTVSITSHTVLDPFCFASCTTCLPTAIQNIGSFKNLSLVPNPAKDYTVLSFGTRQSTRQIQMLDISGRLVASYSNVHSQTLTINVRDLRSGLYFIKITDDLNQTQTAKLIVQ
jgi:hypothetical protein